MAQYLRTEVWSDLQCAGGARLASIPDVAALGDVRRVDGEDRLTLALPVSSVAWPTIQSRRVICVLWDDGAFDEWRVLRVSKKRRGTVDLGVVECVSIRADLGRAAVTRVEADGRATFDFEALQLTPTQHLNAFLLPALTAHGLSWISLGTIDPTTPCDLVYTPTSVLTALQQLATVANAEIQLRRNGTSGYFLDLVTQIGLSAPTRQVRLGRNLLGVEWSENGEEQCTRLYGTGTAEEQIHATIAGAQWRVTNIAGSVVTLADPAGAAGPLAFDDQLNGLYLRKPNGTYTQITDSAESGQTVTLSSASNLSVDDLVSIHTNSSGADLTYLESPAAKALYGIFSQVLDRPDLPGAINLVKNPAVRTWSSGLPVSWQALGGAAVTETTTATRWQHGGKSARVQTTTDGAGLETALIPIVPTASQPHFTGGVSFYLVSGRLRVELEATNGTQSWILPDGTNGKARWAQTDVWSELVVAGVDLHALGATGAVLRIVQDGPDAAEYYVDTAQVTQYHEQEPFVEGSGPVRLWQAVNERLRTHALPQVQIRVDLLDLYQVSPDAFAHESLTLGGTIRVRDEQLNVDITTRIIEYARNLLTHQDTGVVLSNRPEDLTDVLVQSRQPSRQIRHGDTLRELTVQATFQTPSASPATVNVRLAARPANARIQYLVQPAGQSLPIIGAAAWTQYVTPFVVDQSADTDLIVAAYAVLGAHTSAVETWRIAKSVLPGVDLSLSEPAGGTLGISWSPTGDVVEVLIYRKINDWPTTNGDPDGPLDPAYLVGRWGVDPDAGGQFATGIPDHGRTSLTECASGCDLTQAYSASDEPHVIAVPIDTSGRPGPRAAASLVMAGTPSPALTAFAPTLDDPGSNCANPAEVEVAWTPNGSVTDIDHYLLVFRSVNSQPRQQLAQIPDPATTTTYLDTLHQYIDATKPSQSHAYSWELRDSSTHALLASGSGSTLNLKLSTVCPGPPTLTSLNLSKTVVGHPGDQSYNVTIAAAYDDAVSGNAVRILKSYDNVTFAQFGIWMNASGTSSISVGSPEDPPVSGMLYVMVELREYNSDSAPLLSLLSASIALPPL